MQEINKLYDEFNNEKDHFKKSNLLHKLTQEHDLKLAEISENINLSPSYISHIMRLKKLPDLIIDGYYSNQISITHLYIISRLLEVKDMIQIYEKVLTNNLTTLETDDLVRQKLYSVKSEGTYLLDADKNMLIEKLNNILAGKIKIIQTRVKSKIIIELKGSLKETSDKIKKLMNFLSNA